MRTSTLTVAGGLAATAAAAETIHGVLVFSRHGDRTAKHFGNTALTSLGAQQVFQVGRDYHARYLAADSPQRIAGISETEYVPAQVWASAPDSSVLLNTATAFLQGLYPPLDKAATTLANGSSVSSPLTGYQYVTLHGIDDDSPETVWLKGEENCPAVTAASADFKASAEYQSRLESTRAFYRSLYPLVSDIYASADDLSYAKAYDLFDVFNVEAIHNASSPTRNATADQLLQLRTLADSAEFGANYNASQPARSLHAQTFAGSVLSHLNQTVAAPAKNPKFTLLAGSYDTFLAFFGLANLTAASPDFYGLPDYASTMAFELFTPETTASELDPAQLRVRFLFRNGTEGSLTTFPLFASGKADLPWADFVDGMQQRGVATVADWCGACQSKASFCAAYGAGGGGSTAGGANATGLNADGGVSHGSWIAVLVVMAVAIIGNLVWAGMWLVGRRQGSRAGAVATVGPVAAKGTGSIVNYDKESV